MLFQNAELAHRWAMETLGPARQRFTRGERAALLDYKQTWYDLINRSLRYAEFAQGLPAGQRKAVQRKIGFIDRALGKSLLPQPVSVFRCINVPVMAQNLEYLVGRTLSDQAFLSTSLLSSEAMEFYEPETGILVQIDLLAGQQDIYMDALLDLRQYEILLPRGLRLRITSVRRNSEGRREMTTEVENESS